MSQMISHAQEHLALVIIKYIIVWYNSHWDNPSGILWTLYLVYSCRCPFSECRSVLYWTGHICAC